MAEPKKILIAEDDLSINRLLTFKLQKEGFNVISTADGKAALQAALKEDIDAAILDIMMPFLDGIQVLKRIKAEKPLLPVIILSVKSMDRDLNQALELGASDYLTKPFQPGEVVERINRILGEI